MTADVIEAAPEGAPEQDQAAERPVETPTDPQVLAQVDALALVPTQRDFTDGQKALLEARGIKVKDINPAMMQGFLLLCLARGVNPFIGEATVMPTSDGWAAILQIDGYRTIAERTGEYEGRTKPEWCDQDSNWYDAWPKSLGRPFGARVGVYRRGHREADYAVVYTHEVQVYRRVPREGQPGFWDEVLTDRWADTGSVLLLTSKCAEAAAFRIAFPRELDGFYTKEEMERANRLRQENEARRAAEEARAARREAYEEAQRAQGKPERHEVVEDVQEGVVVSHHGDTMDAVSRLRSSAQAAAPAPPESGGVEEKTSPVEEVLPPTEPPAAPEVPADLPLDEDTRAACLRAELEEQAAILGTTVGKMIKRFAMIYEGDPLSTWDSTVLLSIVAFWRPRVVNRLRDLSRYSEAQAYRLVGGEYVDWPDVLFGRSVEPVGDGS